MKLEVVLVASRGGQEVDKPHVVVINRVDPLPQVPARRMVSLLPNKVQMSDIPDSFTIMTYNLLAPYLLQVRKLGGRVNGRVGLAGPSRGCLPRT